jgi:hypothetical protein
MEKAATGPVEKVMVGPCAGEARGRREAWWSGSKTGCRALERRCDGERHGEEGNCAVAEAAQWSVVAESYCEVAVSFFFFFRMVEGEWISR